MIHQEQSFLLLNSIIVDKPSRKRRISGGQYAGEEGSGKLATDSPTSRIEGGKAVG